MTYNLNFLLYPVFNVAKKNPTFCAPLQATASGQSLLWTGCVYWEPFCEKYLKSYLFDFRIPTGLMDVFHVLGRGYPWISPMFLDANLLLHQTEGIYKIPYQCGKSYIGETVHTFETQEKTWTILRIHHRPPQNTTSTRSTKLLSKTKVIARAHTTINKRSERP